MRRSATEHHSSSLSRRAVLRGGLGLAVLGPAAMGATLLGAQPVRAATALSGERVWHRRALDVDATVTLQGLGKDECDAVFAALDSDFAAFEALLHPAHDDAPLARLNTDGFVDDAPADFLNLLSIAGYMADMTGGAFDPTVAPLLALYDRSFAETGAPPAAEDVAVATRRVGFNRVRIGGQGVSTMRPGVQLTLSGIAKGYIVDRVKARLSSMGVRHGLIAFGEYAAVGAQQSGEAWSVPAAPGNAHAVAPGAIHLAERAVATSSVQDRAYDRAGQYHHLLDPKTGAPAHHYQRVTVEAPTATEADALSTGFHAMPVDAIKAVMAEHGELAVSVVTQSGATLRL